MKFAGTLRPRAGRNHGVEPYGIGASGERGRERAVCGVMASATFKEHFRELREGKPGHRFQDHYRHEKRQNRSGRSHARVWRLVAGVALVIVGLVLCVIPGPGLPFIFLGGGLLASESLFVARIMDWFELRVRAVLRWAKARWARLPLWSKIVVGALMVAGSAASMILFYRWVKD